MFLCFKCHLLVNRSSLSLQCNQMFNFRLIGITRNNIRYVVTVNCQLMSTNKQSGSEFQHMALAAQCKTQSCEELEPLT